MSAKITTGFGQAVPPAPRHAVTAHMGPKWETAVQFGADPLSVVAKFKNAYPRTRPHRDIVQLSAAVLQYLNVADSSCLLFPSLQSAQQCAEYATSSKRDNGVNKHPVAAEKLTIRAFIAKEPFLVVIFPMEQYHVVSGFWSTVGVGITSRFAEANLSHLDKLREVSLREAEVSRASFNTLAHETLRQRILSLLQRAPLHRDWPLPLTTSDIFLYQSGMASIYKPHSYMLDFYHGPSVLFGMAFMDTLPTLEQFGPGNKFFGSASGDDLVELEIYLRDNRANGGRKVQAIWLEFPANPLLTCPDIAQLRQLATEYDIVLAIDDTIGGWANIDVLELADIAVTSITKSFNGYGDAIGGAAILNPASPKYKELKSLFDTNYVPEMYMDDAWTFEKNSRDYLTRSAKLNTNASAVVQFLHSRAQHPDSAVSQVYYPSINPSSDSYRRFMRPGSKEFTPGYGCVFSVELEDLDVTKAFYDNLNVHKSVHLGAPFTLAFAYTLCAYQKRLAWAAQFGLKPTQIRISVGLEDTQTLVEVFQVAVAAADRAKREASK